ncbi:MAG TPA: ATP-dependent DNA helicase [Candidatus Dormibacteraeota bacterium]|nr:ATP-dependent DNA helicase [Candidatus Dormibacteraeota bacterium]
MARLFDTTSRELPDFPLNAQQRAAVEHREGPLLVVAGAGTGKTRVITERIRHLLASNPALSGENILGLTFTDKAAAEMKSRVTKAAGERAEGVTLSTFHAFCHALLSKARSTGPLLDKVDHWILLRRNMPRLRLDRYRRLAEPGQFLGDFVDFFSRCQDELVSPERYQQYADGLAVEFERTKGSLDEDTRSEREEEVKRQQEIAHAYRASDELLREKNLLTVGTLVADTVRFLEANAEIRARLQQRFHHIVVDEFQDTNIAQLALLQLLCGPRRNIVVVGDDDQAIYRFRGASFGSFMIFLEKFAGYTRDANVDALPCVSLTENHRSTAKILRVATEVISNNTKSALFPPKGLLAKKDEGRKIRIAEFTSPEEEARWVAEEVQRLHLAGHRWHHFAILYRAHAHRDKLVQELARRRVPFVIKNLSILENRLVRDVVAHMRLVAYPSDNVACARVLATPAWGLDAKELVRLCERASKLRRICLWEALQTPQGELPFSGGAPKTGELFGYLTGLRQTMHRKPATDLLGELIEWLEVHRLATSADKKYFKRFHQFVRDWEAKSETETLPEFLEYLDFFEQANGQISLEEELPDDAVKLMTVHAAKGLEFEHVFILRLSRGGFPCTQRSRVLEFPIDLMEEDTPEGEFHIQEERRLFYVALTRARERLTLTFVNNKRTKPSPFLDDILQNTQIQRRDVERLTPKLPPAQADPPRRELLTSTLPLFPAASDLPRVNSQIGLWAQSFYPPAQRPLQLSASGIETYRSCPQKYLFTRVWGIREGPRAATSFGNIMHTTIKYFMGELRKGNQLPYEEVADIFRREWTTAGFEDDYQQDEYKKDGLEQLRAFHAFAIESLPEVRDLEKFFELVIDQDTIITGRMDQINTIRGRQVEIVDYKTGRPKNEAAANKDLQLSVYALASREVLELDPVRLTFYYLQTNQLLSTTRDEKQLKDAKDMIQEAAGDIRAGEFEAKPGYFCKYCGYRAICPAHEQVVALVPGGNGT